jgi:hypothetical protein
LLSIVLHNQFWFTSFCIARFSGLQDKSRHWQKIRLKNISCRTRGHWGG